MKSWNVAASLQALSLSVTTMNQLQKPTQPKPMVCLYHFYILKLSSSQAFLFEIFKHSTGELFVERSPVDLFYKLKSVSLTTNMDFFGKINQTFIFIEIGIRRYMLVDHWVNFRINTWEFSARFMKLLWYLWMLQKL